MSVICPDVVDQFGLEHLPTGSEIFPWHTHDLVLAEECYFGHIERILLVDFGDSPV